MANPLVDGLGVVNLNVEIEIDLEAKLPIRPDGTTYVDDIKEQHADDGTFFDEPLGTKDLSTPMKLTLSHFMRFSDDVEKVIEALQELQGNNQSQIVVDKVDEILELANTAHRLKVIHRFLDKNQPPLMDDVLPDGSNLSQIYVNPTRSRDLKNEWKLHRHWIKFLHRPGMFTEEITEAGPQLQMLGAVELYALWRSGRYLQELEINNTDRGDRENFPLDHTDPNALDFRWVWTCRARLHEILAQIAEMAYAPQPFTPAQRALAAMRGPAESFIQANMNPLSREEMLKDNLRRNPKLLDNMVAFIHNSMADHPERREGPFLRLVMDLLRMEDVFESRLAVEHAEDKLINKQFSLLDENNLTQSKIGTFKKFLPYILTENSDNKQENNAYKLLSEISLINRSRRNFRLLRDWTGKRPWNSIVQIYDDTLPENRWLRRATRQYQTLLNPKCRTLPLWDGSTPEDPPSNIRYISQRLFGFTPMLTSEIVQLPAASQLKFPCRLCSQPFIANSDFSSSVMGLHCAHHFHLRCIFNIWDKPGNYLHKCPICGDAAQLNFERVGIDYKRSLNFVHNLMDWKVDNNTIVNIHDDRLAGRTARAAYDVPPMPRKRDRSIIHPNDVQDGALTWWMQQNMTSLCALENPLSWKPMTFATGTPARVTYDPPAGFKTDEILRNTRQYDVLARDMGRRWLSLDFEGAVNVAPRTPEQMSVHVERRLPGMRYAPSHEAAWARANRRRRDRRRRIGVLKEGGGLWGLP